MENRKSTIIVILIIVALLVAVLYIKKTEKSATNMKEDLLDINYDVKGNETSLEEYNTNNPIVTMYIKKYGSIVIELYPDKAPNTVNNFIELIKEKYYDNNCFHRLEKGFVLQGGDKKGDGTGRLDYSIKGEFIDNGFKNDLKHKKGMVSMARSQDFDSASSQFFICLADSSNLDGQYAVFGKVIDGWKNIEKIEKNEEIANMNTGKLKENLIIVKTLIDLKGKEYSSPETIKK